MQPKRASSRELEARVEMANQLLRKGNLPPKVRLRVALLRLLAQKRLAIRQKFPELDREEMLH